MSVFFCWKECSLQALCAFSPLYPQTEMITNIWFWGSAVICIFTSQINVIEIEKGFYSTEKCPFMCMLVIQSCPTPCDPMDSSPPSSSVHGILQARTLE